MRLILLIKNFWIHYFEIIKINYKNIINIIKIYLSNINIYLILFNILKYQQF